MSRPRNVRNPFDWKRSMILDLGDVGAITPLQRDALLKKVDDDEGQDRREGERELAALQAERQGQPWWKRWWSW